MHVADWKHETSVDDNGKYQDTGESHGLRDGFRNSCHGAEDGCHHESAYICDCGRQSLYEWDQDMVGNLLKKNMKN
jgi:hypothetical protein